MSKLIIGIIAIIALGAGGYFIYSNYSAPSTNNTNNNETTTTEQTQDQVQVQDLTVGDGAEATPGSIVSVLYRGQLEDGTVFDSSEAHGNEPLVFTLGQPGLIPGFQIGINGMKVGGERVMVIPPSLAYGAEGVKDPEGNVVVPGNVNTVFNVVLLEVKQGSSETTPTGSASDSEQ